MWLRNGTRNGARCYDRLRNGTRNGSLCYARLRDVLRNGARYGAWNGARYGARYSARYGAWNLCCVFGTELRFEKGGASLFNVPACLLIFWGGGRRAFFIPSMQFSIKSMHC